PSSRRPAPVPGLVRHDPQDPRAERRSGSEPVQRSVGLHEGLLHDVLHVGSGHEVRDSRRDVLVPPDELLVRARIASPGLFDALRFIVVHQVYELWFKELVFELETTRDRISSNEVPGAIHLLQRVHEIERVLVEQVSVLETMSPQDFLAFRSKLAPASGFQSVQFREIEFLSGLKEPKYVARLEATPAEMDRLRERLDAPSVEDAFRALLRRRGSRSLVAAVRPPQTQALPP